MTPTPDQLHALSLIKSFITEFQDNPDESASLFSLLGYAGTGKTFCITDLVKSGFLAPSKVVFTAPTNKAVKVLREYLRANDLDACSSCTIFSLLNLSLQANGEVKEITKPQEPVDLSSYSAIIVDEASMVNKFLFAEIESAAREWKVPFIFMGDPAQLPPVGESHSPTMTVRDQVQLTEVLRYGNSMLDLATSIRKVVDHPFPTFNFQNAPPVFKINKAEWTAGLLDNLDGLADGSVKAITWRNVKVAEYNQIIRRAIFGPDSREPWLIGDKIMAKEPIQNFDRATIMQTAEEGTIEAVNLALHPVHREYECFHLKVKHENGRIITIYTLTPAAARILSDQLSSLASDAKGGKKYLWREYWRLKEAFPQVVHAYAITAHSSQGSSYEKSFVDAGDILLNRNRNEAFRALYVACTRQREELWITL